MDAFKLVSEVELLCFIDKGRRRDCAFREIGAVISRDRGRLFHGIAGSHFAVAGRLIDGSMESGREARVKGFHSFAAHAFA